MKGGVHSSIDGNGHYNNGNGVVAISPSSASSSGVVGGGGGGGGVGGSPSATDARHDLDAVIDSAYARHGLKPSAVLTYSTFKQLLLSTPEIASALEDALRLKVWLPAQGTLVSLHGGAGGGGGGGGGSGAHGNSNKSKPSRSMNVGTSGSASAGIVLGGGGGGGGGAIISNSTNNSNMPAGATATAVGVAATGVGAIAVSSPPYVSGLPLRAYGPNTVTSPVMRAGSLSTTSSASVSSTSTGSGPQAYMFNRQGSEEYPEGDHGAGAGAGGGGGGGGGTGGLYSPPLNPQFNARFLPSVTTPGLPRCHNCHTVCAFCFNCGGALQPLQGSPPGVKCVKVRQMCVLLMLLSLLFECSVYFTTTVI